jgi:large subunit ribosomal protein L15
MPHKRRKIRKKRGSRTVGYGRVGQHRGGGQRGGHGKAGRRKHLWSYVLRHEPDYFEKKGFNPPRKSEPNIINVGELDEEVNNFLAEGKATKKVGGIHVDLKELGYDKLLGSGKVTHPFIVRVDSYSKSAAEKIKKVKGKILQTIEEKAIQPSSIEEKSEISTAETIELVNVKGIGQKRSEKLRKIGISSVEDLAKCEPKDLAEKVGVSEKMASKWIKNASELLSIR